MELAVKEHRAEVVLFGCTAMSGYIDALSGKYDIPVVEPMASAISMARLGLSHSKRRHETLPGRRTAPDFIEIPHA